MRACSKYAWTQHRQLQHQAAPNKVTACTGTLRSLQKLTFSSPACSSALPFSSSSLRVSSRVWLMPSDSSLSFSSRPFRSSAWTLDWEAEWCLGAGG